MPATEDEIKKALKAFRKRMKLTRLDDESRLGRSPLSGNSGKITAIQPPSGFTTEIWETLVLRGFLKRDGGGFYELVPGK